MTGTPHTFVAVSPDNKALQFLSKRIMSENYRGSRSSQHNRYTMDEVHAILKLLDEFVPDGGLMQMRTTDLSKRPQPLPGEYKYTQFCEQCARKLGKGTPDAMRKNLFPDFHRMGLINRYRADKSPVDPYDNGPKKYVSLSKMGLRFVRASSLLDRHFIFAKGVNELLEGRIDVLLTLFDTPEYGIKRISSYEYMFFVSAIGGDPEFQLTVKGAVDMICEFRALPGSQRHAVIDALKEDLTPKQNVPKQQKRDFHNWHNKIQQIYYLLKQTRYFDVNDQCLIPIYQEDSESRLERSLSERREYFRKHGVIKQLGFELHHVVPLSYSECMDHFKLLDTWDNMVYIDGYTHAQMTQKRHKNVIMKLAGDDIELLDYQNTSIRLVHDKNIKYSPLNQPIMIRRNKALLDI